ncbi:MAG: family 20 glycosylhydrolase, partial [Bacteroidota bacterium]
DDQALNKLAKQLQVILKPTGLPLPIANKSSKNYIELKVENTSGNKEAYHLDIQEKKLILKGTSPAAIFRGLQTLRQLLPNNIEAKSGSEVDWLIPSGNIVDAPYFEYRGSMLDVSRHFFRVDDVKRYIDLLAYHKMNYFHMHLADDQGWRLEIKSWPKLTEIGGSTEVGGGKGGFYTQEEYKEIVNYAADRYITVIPEIDMPGHTNAALASYPELNCDNKAPELYTGMEVGFSSLCVRKDITYKFLEDVFREVAALTPGPYIHIGGDESHSTKKEDYTYFIERVQKMVEASGKKMMGWADIVAIDEKLSPSTLAQFWATEDNAVKAIKNGAKVLMSPAKRAYIDMKYDSSTELGLKWAAYIEVDKAYNWQPENYVKGVGKENIVGIESPLWSETIEDMDDIEFLAYPRLCGYAEIGWTNPDLRKWEEYKERLAAHGKRLEMMGVDFYRSPLVDWK